MSQQSTFVVSELMDVVNEILRESSDSQSDYRNGVITIVGTILLQAHAYKGFRYLTSEEMSGVPGIVYQAGNPHPDYEERFKDTDPTRIQFFY